MSDYVRTIVGGQLEAALAMLREVIEICPEQHWDGPIGQYPFWQVAYHTLCFADLYVSPGEKSFQPRPIHPRGWREYDDEYPSRRFSKQELVDYATLCQRLAAESLAKETPESLEGPTGFSRLTFSRGELHIYNARHIQHHTGQLSAFLRRVDPSLQGLHVMKWVRSGRPTA